MGKLKPGYCDGCSFEDELISEQPCCGCVDGVNFISSYMAELEEMADVISDVVDNAYAYNEEGYGIPPYAVSLKIAEHLYNAGYHKQTESAWEWFEDWIPSTPEHPRECNDCGWRCHNCETALADAVGGYWDDPEEMPNLKFCPNCGAKMKGGAE